jgi:hypothetical protein
LDDTARSFDFVIAFKFHFVVFPTNFAYIDAALFYSAVSLEVRVFCITASLQGLVSVSDRVAARVIARERRGRILSNFHIVESMPKSISILIHYIHLVHGLVLCLV